GSSSEFGFCRPYGRPEISGGPTVHRLSGLASARGNSCCGSSRSACACPRRGRRGQEPAAATEAVPTVQDRPSYLTSVTAAPSLAVKRGLRAGRGRGRLGGSSSCGNPYLACSPCGCWSLAPGGLWARLAWEGSRREARCPHPDSVARR